jgi:ElaB/YqjD/DUF883 family membrane-anchored ribosome-binding protein
MATSPRSAASSSTGNGPKDSAQDIAADLAQLREDISRLAAEIKALGEKSARTARRAAADKVDELRAQGEAAVNSLRGNAEDLEDELVARVREKPIASLAMAFGAGYLLAMIMRR